MAGRLFYGRVAAASAQWQNDGMDGGWASGAASELAGV
jgi:hypothetical protein